MNSSINLNKIDLTKCKPVRIQFAFGNRLQAEVIVDSLNTAIEVSSDFATAKYRKGSSAGSTVIRLAEIPRVWNVPIGGVIK